MCAHAPAGPVYPTAGMVRRSYVDSTRHVWGGSEPRPLVTLIWYPSNTTAPAETLSIGPPSAPLLLAGVVTPGAPLADRGPYPLIVLSHGTGGSAVQLAWLGTALARHGYIAAAINHHGNTGAEGRYDARGFLLWWERARDMSTTIDRLLEDPLLGTKIDRERIGAAGFSLGGYTVLALAGARTDLEAFSSFCASAERDSTCDPQPEMPAAHQDFARLRTSDPVVQASLAGAGDPHRDERVGAIAAIAPALGRAFTTTSLRQVAIPVLVVSADSDRVAPPPTNAEFIHGRIRASEIVRLASVGHYTFLSACTAHGREQLGLLCRDSPNVSREAVHDRVSNAVRTFFDQVLAVGR